MSARIESAERFPWAAIMVLVIGPFMAILDGSIVNVALPKIMAIFGVGTQEIQWVLTGYLLVNGVVVPVTGYLCDRLGYRAVYIYSLAAFTLGSALCGMAWNNNSLVAFRLVQGIGGGMMVPVSMGMMYRIVPREKMGMAMGMWGIAAAMAPATGPTLGGYLVDNFDWRLIFTINIPIGVVAVLLSALFLTETERRPEEKFDLVGFLLCSVGCFALLLALSEGEDWGWTSQAIVTLFVVAVFSLTLFVLWELSIPEPMLDVRLLLNPVLAASLAATAIITIGMFAGIFLIPIFAQVLMGLTPMQTGLLLMPMALTTGLMMPISGRLFDRIGALPLGLAGLFIIILTTYQLHTISLDTSSHWLQMVLVLRAVGMGLAMMPISTAGLNTVPPQLSGRATALNNLVRQISASLGIAFLTWVMTVRNAFHAAWLADGADPARPILAGALAEVQVRLRLAGASVGQEGVVGLFSSLVQREAMVAAIGDTFLVSAFIIMLAVPLVFFLSKKRVEAQRAVEMARYGAGTELRHGHRVPVAGE